MCELGVWTLGSIRGKSVHRGDLIAITTDTEKRTSSGRKRNSPAPFERRPPRAWAARATQHNAAHTISKPIPLHNHLLPHLSTDTLVAGGGAGGGLKGR